MELSQVIKEIRLVPDNRLPEIHDFIRSLAPDTETRQDDTARIVANVMEFAGCWRDLTDEEFADFSQEIAEHRNQAFSGRIGREAVID
uniref:Uncharacterized protein n=1 Tax=Candidatus Kentrum sp. FM TaxID=2126340 RepID=A0A450TF97_9GAMM|nr:MAG: hypothetical protein BECKFM1743C_GA0114222_104059 [Candidatus Kentron sp. FM]VFJ77208.1 MAG: hypothetical protein BECKFM1743A_GA0114220_109684 [Candidatus Kentron sp. FM]VFK22413.1 MAG: hypothetical protein BECKFM1743B_GA0114221_108584 [Candidatus Kentron sp. FM]